MNSSKHVLRDSKRAWPGVALVAGAGLLFLVSPLGGPLANESFDLCFMFRPDLGADEVALVYMDDASHQKLSQPSVEKWNRSLHGSLIDELVAAHARAVVFDVWFEGATTNDAALLRAIAAATNAGTQIVLAGLVQTEMVAGQPVLFRPMPPFCSTNSTVTSAEPAQRVEDTVPWGLVQAGRHDQVRREHFRPRFTYHMTEPTLAWQVANLTLTNVPPNPDAPRWFNFYGPPGHLPAHSYYRVREPGAIPATAFSNKVVFVGANASVGFTGGTGTDQFETPYSWWNRETYPGVDLNATAYLNLARQDWLRRLPAWLEFLLVLTTGAGLALGLARCTPARAAGVAALVGAVAIVAALLIAWRAHWWFSWLTIAGIQIPVALGWSVLTNSIRLARENAALQARLRFPPAGLPTTCLDPSTTTSIPAQARQVAHIAGGPATHAPSIPDHEMLKLVGTGGYGEIWLARNAIGTYHAVKILRRASFDSDEPFEREFRGLQKFMPISLSHPGLVHILHVGRNDASGLIYYVMEAADDETTGSAIEPSTYSPRNLSRIIKQRGALEANECLRLGRPLAAALGHLHSLRLIHRDIKPANIIFREGAPKLADIGLVTEVGTIGRETSFVGTEGYIPPEGPGQPSADVFALGMLLYETLSGLPRSRFPALPDNALQRPDAEQFLALNDVILKECAPEPTKRHSDGTALYHDLARLAD